MKFLVLIWEVLFLMFSITASDRIAESYTFINSTNLVKPGCESRCGDLIVPYPFGLGDNPKCYIDAGFRIYCNTSLNPPKATVHKITFPHTKSIKLISDSTIRMSNSLSSVCFFPNGTTYDRDTGYYSGNIHGQPYSLSKVNKFTVIGCYSSGSLYNWTRIGHGPQAEMNLSLSTGCMVYCSNKGVVVAGECTGGGCCQSSIPHSMVSYMTFVSNLTVHEWELPLPVRTWEPPCSYAFVGEENLFKFNGIHDLNDTNFKKRIEDTVPLVLEWAIGNLSCSEAKATDGFACQSKSICVNSTRDSGGYRCECKEGYEGNPYLSPGCQVIN